MLAQEIPIPLPGDDSIPLPGEETVPLPGDDETSIPLPGEETVPLPGVSEDEDVSTSVEPEFMPSFPFDVRGYIENTTNIEYLKEEETEQMLNTTRARVDAFGKPDPSLDFGLGLVGIINRGTTTFNLLYYMPEDIQEEIVPGAEMFFIYQMDKEELFLQEAFGSWYTDHFWLRLGRQKFYTGTGYAYNPIDLFNVKDPLDPTYETDGIDAFLMNIDFPRQTELQGLIYFGEEFETTNYLARLKTFVRGWDLALQYTYYIKELIDWEILNTEEAVEAVGQGVSPEAFVRSFRWNLIGGEFIGEIYEWAVYGEGGYVFSEPLDEVGTLEKAAQDHVRLLLGIDHTFDIQLYFMLEYLRLSQGVTDPAAIRLNDRMAYLTGEVLAIDRDTIFSGVSYPLTEFIDLALYSIIGCNDPSLILNPWLYYNLRPGLNLTLVANIPVGSEESQNGNAGPSGFVRLKWYF